MTWDNETRIWDLFFSVSFSSERPFSVHVQAPEQKRWIFWACLSASWNLSGIFCGWLIPSFIYGGATFMVVLTPENVDCRMFIALIRLSGWCGNLLWEGLGRLKRRTLTIWLFGCFLVFWPLTSLLTDADGVVLACQEFMCQSFISKTFLNASYIIISQFQCYALTLPKHFEFWMWE